MKLKLNLSNSSALDEQAFSAFIFTFKNEKKKQKKKKQKQKKHKFPSVFCACRLEINFRMFPNVLNTSQGQHQVHRVRFFSSHVWLFYLNFDPDKDIKVAVMLQLQSHNLIQVFGSPCRAIILSQRLSGQWGDLLGNDYILSNIRQVVLGYMVLVYIYQHSALVRCLPTRLGL